MGTFLYILGDRSAGNAAIVDPAWDVPFLRKEAEKMGLKITSVFLTHGHHDHVNGLAEILKTHDVPVYISKHEAAMYKPKHKNIVEIKDREKLKLGNVEF